MWSIQTNILIYKFSALAQALRFRFVLFFMRGWIYIGHKTKLKHPCVRVEEGEEKKEEEDGKD